MAVDAPAVELTRVLPAPPDRVFRSWTDPGELRHWLTPEGFAEAEVDLRVGGRLRVVMAGAGMRIEHTGEYREIDPPHRLAFTWRSEYTGDEPTLVTVELRPNGDGTELRLRHELLPPDLAASHGEGWGRILARLVEHLGEA